MIAKCPEIPNWVNKQLLTAKTHTQLKMDKTERIKKSIEPIISLTEEELATFCSAFECKRIGKNGYFLQEGEVCDYIGLLTAGVLIYVKTLENGDEVTIHFAFEGDWVNNNVSRLSNAPSTISIKAIQDTEILIIKQSAITDLYLKIPKVERLGRILTEQAFIKFVEQTIEFQTLPAKERYENLLKNHPLLFQKVQLYHIANYLGIAPKSLSRIRKELFD
jgi:CRP-like cAMP-binding protein